MKVLIYGYRGWIGQKVHQLLIVDGKHEVVLGQCRVDSTNDVEKEIITHKPTHIMAFIGRTHGRIGEKVYSTIDYLENEGKLQENIRDNLFSPIILAILAKKYKIHYTYLGTGCIFNYDEEHQVNVNGFTEKSKPNFFGSSYSIVKGYTDQLMDLMEDNALNLRIRMPITNEKHHRNFITKITAYKKICSISNSMSVLPDLLPIMIDMAEKNIVGTYNFTNPGTISHNEILELYKKYVDSKFTWENFTIDEQNEILLSKRSNNYLDTTKLEKLYPKLRCIYDAVEDMIKTYK